MLNSEFIKYLDHFDFFCSTFKIAVNYEFPIINPNMKEKAKY